MDKFDLICDLVIAVCGLIPTLVSIILLVRNTIKEKNWQLVENITKNVMTEVECYAGDHDITTSEEKLNLALTWINAGLEAAGIAIDETLVTKITAYIQEMCKWSKTVNAK